MDVSVNELERPYVTEKDIHTRYDAWNVEIVLMLSIYVIDTFDDR